MRFNVERKLKIYAGNNVGWAKYRWDNGSQRWIYYKGSEGFFRTYDFPNCFSEDERLLLEIKYSDS